MVTVIKNWLEEFKASYNPNKFQHYFISSQGITNSSILVESVSENCYEVFPALVVYPGVPLFSVSHLKEGDTGARQEPPAPWNVFMQRETLACCVLIPRLCMHSPCPLCQCLLCHKPLIPPLRPLQVHTWGSCFGRRVLWWEACLHCDLSCASLWGSWWWCRGEVGSLLMEFWVPFILLSL